MEKNEIFDTIMARTSIRSYTSQPIQEDKIEMLLRAGMAAPSACNKQPWHFIIICLVALTFSLPTNAQHIKQDATLSDSTSTKFICNLPEELPEFPGGPIALKQYIHDHLRWPKKPSRIQKKIRIIIVCTIDEKGRVKNIKVMRGFAPEYDKEAIRVVKKLPKWKPGKMNGKAYKSKYCIPVVFEKEI